MTLRSDIHAALDAVTPAAPHLPSTVVDAVLAAPSPRPRWRRSVILGLTAAAAILVLSVVMVAGLGLLPGLLPGRIAPAGTLQPRPAALVITKWVKDPSVVNGPWPGYRPQIAYRGTLASVHAARNPNGGDWVLEFSLDSQAARAFASLTTEAVAACPDAVCPERHLADWLGLTQDDIDHWNERANTLYVPASQGGKLLADPYVAAPITGGHGYIEGNFSLGVATDLARRLGGQ